MRVRGTCDQCGAAYEAKRPRIGKHQFCRMVCYNEWRKRNRGLDVAVDPIARIAQRVHVNHVTGCIEWTGAVSSGYGSIGIGRSSKYTHRLVYELCVSPIPDGLHIDHLCRNRVCCNPDHLEPVTPRENVLRGSSPAADFARARRCKRGHELTPENVYIIPRTGHRQCLPCKKARAKTWWANRGSK